jgi:hypothetical protein
MRWRAVAWLERVSSGPVRGRGKRIPPRAPCAPRGRLGAEGEVPPGLSQRPDGTRAFLKAAFSLNAPSRDYKSLATLDSPSWTKANPLPP